MNLALTKLTAKDEVDFMRGEVFKDRKKIAISVEGKNDKPFWSFVFDRSEFKGAYKIYDSHGYPTPKSSGKDTLKYFLPYTQSDYAICIDSDYDYLLQNPVWKRRYVFQTYTYSIENYYCYVPSLKNVLNRAANVPSSTKDIPFADIFIKQFSTIIYELMVESCQEATNTGSSEEARRNLGKSIRLHGHTIEEMLSRLTTDIQNKIQQLEITDDFRKLLTEKGLTPETSYLFVRGHDVFNSVFLPVLKIIREKIRKDKLLELAIIDDAGLRKATEKAYRMGVIDVKTCLLENYDFVDSFLFQKIEEDIRTCYTL